MARAGLWMPLLTLAVLVVMCGSAVVASAQPASAAGDEGASQIAAGGAAAQPALTASGAWMWQCTGDLASPCAAAATLLSHTSSVAGSHATLLAHGGVPVSGRVALDTHVASDADAASGEDTPVVTVQVDMPASGASGDADTAAHGVSVLERYFKNGTAVAHAWSWQRSVDAHVACVEAPPVGVAGFATIDPRLPVEASRGSAAGELRLFRGRGVEMWLRGDAPMAAAASCGVLDTTTDMFWDYTTYQQGASALPGRDVPPPACASVFTRTTIAAEASAGTDAPWAPWVMDAVARHSGGDGLPYAPYAPRASPMDDTGKCACNGDPLADLPAPWWLVIVAIVGLGLGCTGGFFMGYARHKNEAKKSLQYEPLVNLI